MVSLLIPLILHSRIIILHSQIVRMECVGGILPLLIATLHVYLCLRSGSLFFKMQFPRDGMRLSGFVLSFVVVAKTRNALPIRDRCYARDAPEFRFYDPDSAIQKNGSIFTPERRCSKRAQIWIENKFIELKNTVHVYWYTHMYVHIFQFHRKKYSIPDKTSIF